MAKIGEFMVVLKGLRVKITLQHKRSYNGPLAGTPGGPLVYEQIVEKGVKVPSGLISRKGAFCETNPVKL